MVERIALKTKQIRKTARVGNDKRQFILRIPTKISDKTVLVDYKQKYLADFIFDPERNNEIIVRLRHG